MPLSGGNRPLNVLRAFEQFIQHARPEMELLRAGSFDYLDGFTRAELPGLSTNEEVCERLASRGTEYILDQIVRIGRVEGLGRA